MDLMSNLWFMAMKSKKTIVLPEGEEPRTILAAAEVLKQGLANLILIGDAMVIKKLSVELNVNINSATIINPKVSSKLKHYAKELYELRKDKGMTLDEAQSLVIDPVYYGTMMVKFGEADGLVSGAVHTTADLLRPALKIIKTAPGVPLVSSFFIMIVPNCVYGENGLFLFSDCAINPDPTADQLAAIAVDTAASAKHLCGLDPRVALLSFSTKGSAEHEMVEKVREALSIIKVSHPQLNIDGELQLDAAIIPSVAHQKAPSSEVAGNANVLIFPDLNAGNIGYKLVERLAKAQAIGPICQGFAKPVNDLSRGCSAEDIVKMIVVTAVQAQMNKD